VTTFDYDVLVLGSGPAGESAALNAMKHGQRVAVIEARNSVGGACTHQGTIPSKALRHMVRQAIRFNNTPAFRDIGDARTLSYPRLLSHANEVITRQVDMRSRFYYRNQIRLIFGRGHFVDKNTVEVVSDEGQVECLTAATVVIATGSRPYRPANIDFSHPRVYDSDTILKMTNTPNKIIVYGAGVIGCEYASIFSGIGIKIELINSRERLLEFLDDEISDALSYQLRNMGVMIRHREVYQSVETSDKGVEVLLESGKRIHADALLWCNGRSGNTHQLGLENIGLEIDHRGQLIVDQISVAQVMLLVGRA
jgi:NAD(P) transhydrogenase